MISKPDTIDQAREVLLGLIKPTCAEEGCVKYELHQNTTDFTFIEEWEDDESLDFHLESEHLVAAREKLGDLLAAPPHIRRYKLIN